MPDVLKNLFLFFVHFFLRVFLHLFLYAFLPSFPKYANTPINKKRSTIHEICKKRYLSCPIELERNSLYLNNGCFYLIQMCSEVYVYTVLKVFIKIHKGSSREQAYRIILTVTEPLIEWAISPYDAHPF